MKKYHRVHRMDDFECEMCKSTNLLLYAGEDGIIPYECIDCKHIGKILKFGV